MEASKERFFAVISHLGGLLAFTCLLGIIIPLVIWLAKGDDSVFINTQAKEALNFQISFFIYMGICVVLFYTIIGIPFALIGYFIFVLTNIICSIKGAIWTSRGNTYRYPMNLRLIP